ncbi:hypothetical protein OLF88_11350, partial [Streptococcus pneumoniae]|nr:hypothetical protein [Streptococcus pneumoniae]
MAAPLLLLDAGGTVLFANARAAALLSCAEPLGLSLSALLAPSGAAEPEAEPILDALLDALRAGRPIRAPLTLTGERRVEAALAPLSVGGFALT